MSKQYSHASFNYNANSSFTGYSGSPEITMHCWAKLIPSTASIWNTAYSIGSSTLDQYLRLRLRPGVGLAFLSLGTSGGEVSATSSFAVANNVWYSCAGRKSANNSRHAYIDGAISAANTVNSPQSSLNTVCVGAAFRLNFKGENINGLVAYPAAWNVALSNDEITALSQGASPLSIRPQNLISYIPYLGRDTNEVDIISGLVLNPTNAPVANNDVPKAIIMSNGATYS